MITLLSLTMASKLQTTITSFLTMIHFGSLTLLFKRHHPNLHRLIPHHIPPQPHALFRALFRALPPALPQVNQMQDGRMLKTIYGSLFLLRSIQPNILIHVQDVPCLIQLAVLPHLHSMALKLLILIRIPMPHLLTKSIGTLQNGLNFVVLVQTL